MAEARKEVVQLLLRKSRFWGCFMFNADMKNGKRKLLEVILERAKTNMHNKVDLYS